MSKVASSSPARDPYLNAKHPKPRKHPSSHRSTQSKVYPKGVSSYLSTFLNDEGDNSNDDGSGSDSDDSFFSYSARFASRDPQPSHVKRHVESNSQRPALSASSMKPHHSKSTSVALRSQHDNQHPDYLNSSPQWRSCRPEPASEPRHHKKTVSLEKGPPTLVAVVASNKRTPSGKSSRGTRSVHPKSEVAGSVEISRLKDKKSPLKSCDAAVQASPPENLTDSGLCKHCQACRHSSSNEPLLPISSTSAIKAQPVTVESSTQTSAHSSPRVSALGSALFSDGNKTDSFASSDALPDDIDRLFDRASFSIHGESVKTNSSASSSINDPDGLRKGLKALLNGPQSSESNSQATHKLPLSPTRAGNAEAQSRWIDKSMSTSFVGPTAIASISGVLFADPFASSVGQRIGTPSGSDSAKYAKSRAPSAQRRKSSVLLPTTAVPPVPVIPDNFRQGSVTRVAEIQRPNRLARLSSFGNDSDLSEIIHPHSPVQISSGFSSGFSPTTGRRISLRPHQDFVFTDPPNTRRMSRGTGSTETTTNWVKTPSDGKFQASFHVQPPENCSTGSIPTIRRPSLWDKIVGSSSTPSLSNSASARPSAESSKTSQAKTRRKLQRKSQSQSPRF